MASPNVLRLSRDQIAATMALSRENKPDAEVVRQVERMVSIVRALGISGSTNEVSSVPADVVLDATGTTLMAQAPQAGLYRVNLTWVTAVVGGSAGNGWTLSPSNTNGLAISSSNYGFSRIEAAAAFAFAIPTTNTTFTTSFAANGVYTLTGVVRVTVGGTFGMKFVKTGAPTSATLKAGSGFDVIRVAE
jgi:hypothetical protein